MTVGSLFSGIGGFDLGFERAGFEIRWQVEIDDYATRVLEKHWPRVRRYRDVRKVHGQHYWQCPLRDDCLAPIDVLVGGFPCQPHSVAGRRKGAEDERDLWPQFARLIRECQPRWVVAENVPGLLSNDDGRFFGGVLRDLAESGYDAEWDCLPASAVGAPHQRDRVWIVAYPKRRGRRQDRERGSVGPMGNGRTNDSGPSEESDSQVADAASGARQRPAQGQAGHASFSGEDVAYTGRQQAWAGEEPERIAPRIWTEAAEDIRERVGELGKSWRVEPNVGRVAHGIPARVDRLKGLGNSIVPQIAEWIAGRITEAERLTA